MAVDVEGGHPLSRALGLIIISQTKKGNALVLYVFGSFTGSVEDPFLHHSALVPSSNIATR